LPKVQQEQTIHLPQQKQRQATLGRVLNLGFYQIRLSLTRIHINSPLASLGITQTSLELYVALGTSEYILFCS